MMLKLCIAWGTGLCYGSTRRSLRWPGGLCGISCGGIFVCPGDIIVGDADGVIVVPKGLARQCLEGGRRLLLNEEVKGPRLADGTGDRSWVEKTLDQKGCETIDGIWLP